MTDIVSHGIKLVAFQIRDGRPWYLLLRPATTEVGTAGDWEVVQGRCLPDEPPPRTAIRRLLEWTELDPNALWTLDHLHGGYDVETGSVVLTPCFAAQVSGSISLSDRHEASRWLSDREAVNNCTRISDRRVIEAAHAQCGLPLAAGSTPARENRIV